MRGVASDAPFHGKRDRGAVRESGSGSPGPAARPQRETAGQAGRDITVLQRLSRCRSQFGCIAGQNDAATATPNSINEDEASPKRGLRGDPFSMVGKPLSTSFDAGVPLRDVQEAASHADPRTTIRYDRARGSLDRHATCIVAAYVAGACR